jgi:hypothetical protein
LQFLPPPTLPPAPDAGDTPWQAPVVARADDPAAIHAKLSGFKNLWGKPPAEAAVAAEAAKAAGQAPAGAVGDGKTAAPAWSLAGIVRRGDQAYVLGMQADGKVAQYQDGATLPGGETLLSVQPDTIEIGRADGGSEMLRLFRKPLNPPQSAAAPK